MPLEHATLSKECRLLPAGFCNGSCFLYFVLRIRRSSAETRPLACHSKTLRDSLLSISAVRRFFLRPEYLAQLQTCCGGKQLACPAVSTKWQLDPLLFVPRCSIHLSCPLVARSSRRLRGLMHRLERVRSTTFRCVPRSWDGPWSSHEPSHEKSVLHLFFASLCRDTRGGYHCVFGKQIW